MCRIYFDTEFTGLMAHATLVSIGLIDESGYQSFYEELSDTYSVIDCNAFCQQHVLPHLGPEDKRITMAELRTRLGKWLRERGPDTVLICDSHRDVVQINAVFPDGLPENCTLRVLTFVENVRRRMKNRSRRIHRSFGLRMHHALDDAKANRILLSD